VICTSSYEAQVFKKNLDTLIEENIQETGFDPRLEGPPEHIANQEVKKIDDGDGELPALLIKRPDPHYFTTTQSIFKRRYRVCLSEIERMKRASFDEKVQYSKNRLKDLLDKFIKLEESMYELQKLNK